MSLTAELMDLGDSLGEGSEPFSKPRGQGELSDCGIDECLSGLARMVQHREEDHGGMFSSNHHSGEEVGDEDNEDGGADKSGGGERLVGKGGNECASTEQGEQPEQ